MTDEGISEKILAVTFGSDMKQVHTCKLAQRQHKCMIQTFEYMARAG